MFNEIKNIFNCALLEWNKSGHDFDKFPEIAHKALQAEVIFSHEKVLELIDKIQPFGWQSFPNNEFGEIPITIFSKDNILIDIYIWNHSNTATHDHHFCGAFKVLHGLSQQYKYKFEPAEKFNENITKGKLIIEESKKIEAGHIEKIYLYEKFIHNVLHLNYPTVTLCLRTGNLDKSLNYYYDEVCIYFPKRNKNQLLVTDIIQYAYMTTSEDRKEFTFNLLNQQNEDDLFNILFDRLQPSNQEMHDDIIEYINSKGEHSWPMLVYKTLQRNVKLYAKINFLKNLN